MTLYEYWIGRGIDLDDIWNSYEKGYGYIDKFHSMEVHLIEFTFSQQPELPLFNHEVIYKTIKGYSHEIKRSCYTENDYNQSGPLFLYSINRNSSIWRFLGELRQLLMLGTTLSDEKCMGEKLNNIEKKLNILRENFGGNIDPKDFEAFMDAKTPPQIDQALKKMIGQGLESIQVSSQPFKGDIEETQKSLLDMKKLLGDAN